VGKKRIDLVMVEKNLVRSREKAKALILSGIVYIDEVRIEKPGQLIDDGLTISIREKAVPYVSRGGLKLDKALNQFDIDIKDKVFIDIGASTGGFTDCLLKHGAQKVFSIDVGYGQLAWELRNDSRVVVMERTNIRNVSLEDIGFLCDGAVIDVSFISLEKVLPVALSLIRQKADIVALIKPQFEAGREYVGKNGVIRDQSVHVKVIEKIVDICDKLMLDTVSLTYSPVKGPKGNIEFIIHLKKCFELSANCTENVRSIVAQAHAELN